MQLLLCDTDTVYVREQTWDPNMHHVRQLCSEHPFSTTASRDNCTACNNVRTSVVLTTYRVKHLLRPSSLQRPKLLSRL